MKITYHTHGISAAEDIDQPIDQPMDDDMDDDMDDADVKNDDQDVDVTPEASDLLFETEDVAQLVAEITGEDVEVTTSDDDEDDAVTFTVGDQDFTVQPDEDMEEVTTAIRIHKPVVKAARNIRRTRTAIKSNTNMRSKSHKAIRRITR